MTTPRKEQINDQRTFFTRIDGINGPGGVVPLGYPDALNGTIQTIQNGFIPIGYPSGPYYTNFLAETVTGVSGGAETTTPAFFFGNPGPFTTPVAAGASFSITLPGINSGNPVLITFQSSDVVLMSSYGSVITTSKAAARINTALTSAGVSSSSPVASNVNGKLVLTSANSTGYTFGESALITVNDVTPGVCNALGFTSTPPSTSTGVNSPQRGAITTSADGMGGFVSFQALDGSPAITNSPYQINVGGFGNLPIYPAGQPVYGRMQLYPGVSGNPKIVITYVRQGNVPGKIVTNGGNFSTLLNTDTFTVTVNTINPALQTYVNEVNSIKTNGVQSYVCHVSFGSTPAGPQDVINAINTAWNATAQASGYFPSGQEAGRAGVQGQIAGPYQFTTGGDSFWLAFNNTLAGGGVAIQIAPTTGTYSAQDLVTYINGQISASILAGQGAASVAPNGSVQIFSTQTTGSSSIVQIIPGDLSGGGNARTQNTYIATLNKLGISPGVYTGSAIAKLYGNDEIQIVSPDHTILDPYAVQSGVTITGSSTVMAKLGLVGTTVSNFASVGVEIVSPPVPLDSDYPSGLRALVPEILEFGEIPDNIETTTNDFLNNGIPSPASIGGGTTNVGVSPLMGLDGKINPDLLNKIFDVLNVDSLTLGGRNLGFTQGNQLARLITPFAAGGTNVGMTLIWQGSSTAGKTGSGASQIMRLYADSLGGLWLTCNAGSYGTSPATPVSWTADIGGQAASAIYITQSGELLAYPKISLVYAKGTDVPSPPTTFSFNGTPFVGPYAPVALDPTGAGSGGGFFAHLGTATNVSLENLVARLMTAAAPGDITLLWAIPSQNVSSTPVPGVRIYVTQTLPIPSSAGVGLWFVINAFWSGTAWVKDIDGQESNAIFFSQSALTGSPAADFLNGNFTVYYQAASNNTNWTTWGSIPGSSIQTANINGPLNQIQSGTLVPGFNIPQTNTGRSIPRIFANVDSGTSTLRTLIEQWGSNISPVSGGGMQVRTYRGFGFTGANNSGPGTGSAVQADFFMMTVNAFWNSSINLWVKDVPTGSASMEIWWNSGSESFVASPGVNPFPDSLWVPNEGPNSVFLQAANNWNPSVISIGSLSLISPHGLVWSNLAQGWWVAPYNNSLGTYNLYLSVDGKVFAPSVSTPIQGQPFCLNIAQNPLDPQWGQMVIWSLNPSSNVETVLIATDGSSFAGAIQFPFASVTQGNVIRFFNGTGFQWIFLGFANAGSTYSGFLAYSLTGIGTWLNETSLLPSTWQSGTNHIGPGNDGNYFSPSSPLMAQNFFPAPNSTLMIAMCGVTAGVDSSRLLQIIGTGTPTDVTPSILTGKVITGLAFDYSGLLWGLVIFDGTYSYIYTSPDGLTWTLSKDFSTVPLVGRMSGLAMNGNVWITTLSAGVSESQTIQNRLLVSTNVVSNAAAGIPSTWSFAPGLSLATNTQLPPELVSNGNQFGAATNIQVDISLFAGQLPTF